MATSAQWTVVFDDKMIIKNNGPETGTGYTVEDNDFWGLAKWSNIWAIQYGTAVVSDQVEYRDATPHSSWDDADLGDVQDVMTKWDSAHLAKLQSDWDNSNVDGESEEDKISRLGARPTSYSS